MTHEHLERGEPALPHPERYCGLLAEKDMPLFQISPLSIDTIHIFDVRAAASHEDTVDFVDQRVRRTKHFEGPGNIVRCLEIDSPPQADSSYVTYNYWYIEHVDGNAYAGRHKATIGQDGSIHEPEIGDLKNIHPWEAVDCDEFEHHCHKPDTLREAS